jgi:hypothetical protein
LSDVSSMDKLVAAEAGMIKAAEDLYGATSTQCTATVKAWKAVNVTPTETCGTTTPPPTGSNLLVNPGFESRSTGWTRTLDVITNDPGATPQTGTYFAWLDGYGTSHTDVLSQPVTIPPASTAKLSFYLRIRSADTTSTAHDTLKVQVISGNTTTTLARYSNLNKGTGYVARSVNLGNYTGQTVTVKSSASKTQGYKKTAQNNTPVVTTATAITALQVNGTPTRDQLISPAPTSKPPAPKGRGLCCIQRHRHRRTPNPASARRRHRPEHRHG